MREPGEPLARSPARVQKGDRPTGYTFRKAAGVTVSRDPLYNWLPWRHKERTEKLLSMHLVVPWDRVALRLLHSWATPDYRMAPVLASRDVTS
jgi:hypothetical protein